MCITGVQLKLSQIPVKWALVFPFDKQGNQVQWGEMTCGQQWKLPPITRCAVAQENTKFNSWFIFSTIFVSCVCVTSQPGCAYLSRIAGTEQILTDKLISIPFSSLKIPKCPRDDRASISKSRMSTPCCGHAEVIRKESSLIRKSLGQHWLSVLLRGG